MIMKLLVIGATGFVGSHILEEALDRGHEVHAIARNVDKIKQKNKNLYVTMADIMEENEIRDIMNTGYDAVISSYNSGWNNPNIYRDYMKGYESILQAVRESGIKRIIIIGGAGSLEIDGIKLIDKMEFPQEIVGGIKAAKDLLDIIRKDNDLDWSFVSPAIDLFDGKRTGKYRLGKNTPVFDENKESKISVQDLSVAIIDELEEPKHVRERFTVGY